MASSSLSMDSDGPSTFSFPVSDAKESLRKLGAYVKEDASAGNRVADFIFDKRLPLRKPFGLEFCAQNSFYDKGVRAVIEASITRPYWALAKVYYSDVLDSDTAYFFTHSTRGPEIYVLLFTPDTRFLLFEGSHTKHISDKKMTDLGILSLSHNELAKEGMAYTEHNIKQGGFALIDGRVGWTLVQGRQVAIGYVSEGDIAIWGNYELGDTEPLRNKVSELKANGIKAKFVFVKPNDIASSRSR